MEILSIRNCPKVDDGFLRVTILENPSSTLKGVYYFSDPAWDFSPPTEGGAEIFVGRKWSAGRKTHVRRSWAKVITDLKGKVAFDTETCKSVTHFQSNPRTSKIEEINPRLATMRLRKGCTGCGVHPEVEDHVNALKGDVLFPPAPIHRSDLASAKCSRHLVGISDVRVTLRCAECLNKRYCEGCGKWWCQPCAKSLDEAYEEQGEAYGDQDEDQDETDEEPVAQAGALARTQRLSFDCPDCGLLCMECVSSSSEVCVKCNESYCAEQYVLYIYMPFFFMFYHY